MKELNPILQNAFEPIEQYVNQLEEYALLGMMCQTVSHEFNVNLGRLRSKIDKLPDKTIGSAYNDCFSLFRAIMDRTFRTSKSTRSVITVKEIKDFCKEHDVDLEVKSAGDFLIHDGLFWGVLFELCHNGKRFGRDVTVEVMGKAIRVYSKGSAPQRPDRIFDLGYSEAKGGAPGVGLFLCKRLLAKEGYNLYYRRHQDENVFIVTFKERLI